MQTLSNRNAARKVLTGFAAAALSLLAAACIFAPGAFTSRLDIRKDRSFSFRYTGEILMIPMMETSKSDKKATFKPDDCYDDDTYVTAPLPKSPIRRRSGKRKTPARTKARHRLPR